ncbi:PhaM family polyhydroxyalkanoate granule multifunctional regulatory protein [Variovorax sp. CCNWLW225]|uniref:PhaM family polyhydroxyalkanoate granule multifunctional regulatory protein n=1 Tax=Variovorax sp. CCNWLW225 TaxID=3127462 RepID=UPI00307743EA
MSNASQPFDFSQFVPGFDFLKNLAGGAAAGSGAATSAGPGLPSLASWVAPTLSVEEVDKRIQELKTVQYWLEQNGHALKATIQALEVQKMTLSTLRGMNVRMEDIASAFTKQAAPAAPVAAPPAEPEPQVEAEEETPAPAKKARSKPASAASASGGDGGVIDPMQWWGSLTEQFQQIATSALHDAAQIKVPAPAAAPAASKPAARKATATAAKKKAPTAARKRTTGRR